MVVATEVKRCCSSEPIVRVFLPHGCAAWDNEYQDLCAQHLRSVHPVDGMNIIREYHPDVVAWVLGDYDRTK